MKKRLWILSALVFFSVKGHADVRSPMFVETENDLLPQTRQANPEFVYRSTAHRFPAELPPLELRDAYFKGLHLDNKLQDTDELDKDLLYWRLHHLTISENKKFYPQFPPSVWENLRRQASK